MSSSFASNYFCSLPSSPDVRTAAERARDDLDFAAGVFRPGPWLTDSRVLDFMTNGASVVINFANKGHIPPVLHLDSAETEYVRALVRDGVLEPGRAAFNHRHRFIRQGAKLRLIFDGRRLNARCPEPPSFQMLSHRALANLAGRFSFAAKFDFRSFFFNVPLAGSIRQFFGLRCDIGDFRWARAPFGWSWSPFFADLLCQSVVSHLRSLGIEIHAYMDDLIIFANSHAECARQLEVALDFCASIGLRVKESKTVLPTQLLTILGVVYDLVLKTSSLDPSYFSSLSRMVSGWSSAAVRKCDLAGLIGSLVFVNNAFPGSLSMLNPLFVVMNQLADTPWLAPINIKPAIPVANDIISSMAAFEPCPLQVANRGECLATLFCDATPVQVGAVVNGSAHAALIAETTVFEAEAMGMAFALSLSSDSDVLVATDNQALFNAIVKGRSPNSVANSLIYGILRARLNGSVIIPTWVPSEANLADYPSRAALNDSAVVFHEFDF